VISKILPKVPAQAWSNHQQLFVLYTINVLVDLTILNLFNEFWELVSISSFSISLLVAILLQVLLKLTLAIEHRVAHKFKSQTGLKAKVLRIISSWGIVFISKLIILKTISYSFGNDVLFGGPIHGLVSFIVVVAGILLAEYVMLRVYKSLA
jgi:hypothetical protein